MKYIILLFILIMSSCQKSQYSSPYGYNVIRLYEYNGKSWDDEAADNMIYKSQLSDNNLYSEIEKLNYSFKESFKPCMKLDSILFKEKYEEYMPEPRCPAGYNHVLLLYDGSKLKYAVKFNEYCSACFLMNSDANKLYYLKFGYEDFMKLMKN